jgi:cystathionine beta-lyase/cystathionine gamma-synthase
VVPYDLRLMREGPPALRGHLVRFSVGLEAAADLVEDVEQALRQLA